MDEKFDAGNFKPPEEIGLTSPHETFAVSTYNENIRDSWKGNELRQLRTSATL